MSNVNVYVWYSSASEDSGKKLAQLLGTDQHGTLPPKDFNGVLVCYGALPGDKFKWENRKVNFIFNDPRNVRRFMDRAELFKTLAAAGMLIPSIRPVAENFDATCAAIGVGALFGITMFKPNGAGVRHISNQESFTAAKAEGLTYASTADFNTPKRTRYFIVDGTFVGALGRSTGNHQNFSKLAAAEQTVMADKEGARALILHLLENGLVDPAKTYWQVLNAVSPAHIEIAKNAAKALKYDFCAVDLNENGMVLNVVTTPDIASPAVEPLQQVIADAVKLWLKRANKSAKEILADLVAEATEEDAEVIVGELRRVKAEVMQAG